MFRWRAVVLGSAVELTAIGAGLVVSFPPNILWAGVILLLSTGLVGGFVAGRLAGRGWRNGAVHGGAVGLVGGVSYALILWFSMTYSIPRASYSAFWGLNYFVATSNLLPRSLVSTYSGGIGIALAILGGALFVVEGIVAGGAGVTPAEPPSTFVE